MRLTDGCVSRISRTPEFVALTFLLLLAGPQRGLAQAEIWCLEGNFAARGFYERCGGRRLSRSKVEEVGGMTLAVVGYGWSL